MIIVTGSVQTSPETLEEAVELSLEHVRRSRLEPGCLLHSVHRDVEQPGRLVFIEHWHDLEALRMHFAVQASRDFSKALGRLSVVRPTIEIYDATVTAP